MPPTLVARWASVMIWVSQSVYERWSMFSPTKSGSACWASAETYFWRAERLVRSLAVRPPLLYGGSVMTESAQPSGRVASTLSASPW